jgi:hypothetical protein
MICIREEVMKFSERQQILFCETENCSCRRMELILNSNQCNINENLCALISSNQNWVFLL